MTETQDRNEEIVELLKQGATVKELSCRFQISEDMIARIRTEARKAADRAETGRSIREQILAANDIDLPWPIEAIAQALETKDVRTRRGLNCILHDTGCSRLTLRQIMDLLLIEPVETMDSPIMFLPVLAEGRNIGWKTALRLLEVAGRYDLGSAFRNEWEKRCKKAGAWMRTRHERGAYCCFLNCGVVPWDSD